MNNLSARQLLDLSKHLASRIGQEEILKWDAIMSESCNNDSTYGTYAGRTACQVHATIIGLWVRAMRDICVKPDHLCRVLEKYDSLDAKTVQILGINYDYNYNYASKPALPLSATDNLAELREKVIHLQTCLEQKDSELKRYMEEAPKLIEELRILKGCYRDAMEENAMLKNQAKPVSTAERTDQLSPPVSGKKVTWNGHVFTIPKRHADHSVHSWNNQSLAAAGIIASGIASRLSDIAAEFDLEDDTFAGYSKLARAQYFVKMLCDLGCLDALQDGILHAGCPGVLSTINRSLFV